MENKSFRRIDRYKLENFILENFSSRQSFCDAIGRSDSWLHESLKRRSMSITDVMAIKGAYGIDVTEEEPITSDIESENLQRAILNELKKQNELLTKLTEDIQTTGIGVFQLIDIQNEYLKLQKNRPKPVAVLNKHA